MPRQRAVAHTFIPSLAYSHYTTRPICSVRYRQDHETITQITHCIRRQNKCLLPASATLCISLQPAAAAAAESPIIACRYRKVNILLFSSISPVIRHQRIFVGDLEENVDWNALHNLRILTLRYCMVFEPATMTFIYIGLQFVIESCHFFQFFLF